MTAADTTGAPQVIDQTRRPRISSVSQAVSLPFGVGFLLRELVDQLGEGSPLLLGQVLQEGDHRLQHLHRGLGRDGVVLAEIKPDDGTDSLHSAHH
ncbi:hypothetical protein [Nonomuraea sp. NPDC003754]